MAQLARRAPAPPLLSRFDLEMPRISKAQRRRREAAARSVQVRKRRKTDALNDPNLAEGTVCEPSAGLPSSNAEAIVVLDDSDGVPAGALSDMEEVAEPSLAGKVTGMRSNRFAASTLRRLV